MIKLVQIYNKMNKKLECIQNLKSKLVEMQRQLKRVSKKHVNLQANSKEKEAYFGSTTPLSNYNSVPLSSEESIINTHSWRNPNYWGRNPITGKQNQSSSPSPSKWQSFKSPRAIKRELSPQISELKSFADRIYYNTNKKAATSKQIIDLKSFGDQKYYNNFSLKQQSPATPKPFNNHSTLKSKRYFYNFHGQETRQKDTPRFQKIRTYDQSIKNPIVNPEAEVERGKRIFQKHSRQSSSNVIQNPDSNPNLFCFGQRAFLLSPKSKNLKNLSPSVKLVLSHSLEQKVSSPKRKSCKKHFAKYFKQTYGLNWCD